MQMHMDFKVATAEDLQRHRQRAQELGAIVLNDRSQEEGEPLYVMADPAGHPFCLLVQYAPRTNRDHAPVSARHSLCRSPCMC